MATSDSPLSVPDITLAVARSAGGGPEPTSAPSISSVTDNGDGTLTILGSNFGSKSQAAPVLVDYVDTAFEHGVENAFTAGQPSDTQIDNEASARIWNQVVTGEVTPGGRVAGQSRMYRLLGNHGTLREPHKYNLNERNDGNRRMYFAAWVKYKYNATQHRMTTDEYTVGTFIPGETISINNGEYIGYFANPCSEPGNFVHTFRFDASSLIQPGKAELVGKTLVGQDSGATLTFPSDANWGSAYSNGQAFVRTRTPKVARFWDDPGGNGLRSSIAVLDAYISTSADIRTGVHYQMIEEWHLFENEIDLTVDGYWGHFIDRVARADQSFDGTITPTDPAFSILVSQYGMDGDIDEGQVTEIAEVYFDKTRQRVYLGDAATFSACTHVELQRPTAWADDGVTVARNDGTLAGDRWVYVAGPGGLINEQGVQA
ncbi:hypothetical protein NLU14_08620 [Marinobacter sp. 71-i]|uniref:Uncharacterized protein n=1 Tax=Marinobacter iranensis TaxID=2962607 RepID=A0ABT5Y9E2_9GAMM|nr:hypothetical protein [Marinobacter iranensis]MDF0750292.1 hypothetical protein [Marinobacter iranensis]